MEVGLAMEADLVGEVDMVVEMDILMEMALDMSDPSLMVWEMGMGILTNKKLEDLRRLILDGRWVEARSVAKTRIELEYVAAHIKSAESYMDVRFENLFNWMTLTKEGDQEYGCGYGYNYMDSDGYGDTLGDGNGDSNGGSDGEGSGDGDGDGNGDGGSIYRYGKGVGW